MIAALTAFLTGPGVLAFALCSRGFHFPVAWVCCRLLRLLSAGAIAVDEDSLDEPSAITAGWMSATALLVLGSLLFWLVSLVLNSLQS